MLRRAMSRMRNNRLPFVGPRAVNEPVDHRWKTWGRSRGHLPGGCFHCRFRRTLRWIKKTLPFADRVTILGVHQVHEHKM